MNTWISRAKPSAAWLSLFVLSSFLNAGTPQAADRVVVPLTDPNKPVSVEVNVLKGSIRVEGYNGRDVVIETVSENAPAAGGRVLFPGGSGLAVTELNNKVEVGLRTLTRKTDIVLKVPVRSDLNLSSADAGDVVVENVAGDLDITCLNGEVRLRGIRGSVVAQALNGDMVVEFDVVSPDKPMSFAGMNGRIEVAFPGDIRATVRARTEMGDIQSEFEIVPKRSSKKAPAAQSKNRDKTAGEVYGTINGGGPEYAFKTFTGNIVLHKK